MNDPPPPDVVERPNGASSRESLRRERHGDQELRGVNKVDQELSRVNKVEPQESPRRERLTSSAKRLPTGCAFRGQQSHQELSRGNKVQPTANPRPAEPAPSATAEPPLDPAPYPDYESLLSRSRDMLDRKYDVTPEGRREANTLALELELMNPPPAKPRKDYFGRVVNLARRLQAANSPAPAIAPVSLNSLGHPIKPTSEYPREWFEPKPDPASAKSSTAEPSASPAPFPAESPLAPVAALASPVAQPPAVSSNPPPTHRPEHFVAPPEGHPRARDFVAPPSRRPEPDWPCTGADGFPGPGPHADPFPPDPLNRTGHTTDWYAPASWSGRRQPDPFPSRQEKLARKLRGMSGYRFRRLQHLQQSKVFWG